MRTSFLSAIVAVCVVIAPTADAYAEIIYTAVSRSVEASYQYPTFGDTYSQAHSGSNIWFDEGLLIGPEVTAIASQASNLQPQFMNGWFAAQGFFHEPLDTSPFAFATAATQMMVHFTVTEATPFELTLSWSTTGFGALPPDAALSTFSFLKMDDMSELVNIEMEMSTTGETISDDLFLAGMLEPGEYLIDAAILAYAASGTDYGSVNSNFLTNMQFQMSFIPAPGAVALLGIAGVGISRRRRG